VHTRDGIVCNGAATHGHKRPNTLMLCGVILAMGIVISTATGFEALARVYSPRMRSVSMASSVGSRSIFSSVKSTLKQCIRALGDAPLLSPVLYHPGVRRVLQTLPGSHVLYSSEWNRKHPFDRFYGTDTSGFLFGEEFLTGHPAETHGSPYAGVQPSVLRTVLATLPELETCTFIDLGCGKGRPMLIASEFPFRDIIGVELSPPLAEAGKKNAVLMAKKYPERARIRVEVGDATVFPVPAGDVVLFLYNSFDRELMLKVAEHVEGALRADSQRRVYVVYCNPASGDCFDASPLLTRRYAKTLPYAREEAGYAPDKEDAVIIWQGGNVPPPTERADAEIVVVKDRWRALLREKAVA
jgi:SAM-dependent methyltransferase